MKLNNLRVRVTAMLAPAALAEDEPITNEDDLRTAIVKDANIVLGADIELTSNLAISVDGVTIDGQGQYKISAGEAFPQAGASYKDSLLTVTGDGLTLKGITLETGNNNAHVLNLFEAEEVTLDNVTLDHTYAYKGAPLMVASSTVTAQNGLHLIAGLESWYGINLDNGTGDNEGDASLTFYDNNVTFQNETGKDLLLVQLDYKKTDGAIDASVENKIVNPENAGLQNVGPSGQYLPKVITVTTEDGLRAAAALKGANIVLGGNIKLLNNVTVTADDVTIDGSGYKIYADTDFKQTVQPNQDGDSAANSLFTVSGDKVILKNITMETGANNVHALNLYEAQGTTLENVTLDHTNAYKGAPLVVNSSTAAVKGSFKTITGAKSWYAINLDNKKTDVDPQIDFTQATSVTFDKAEGTTAKYPLYTELTEKAPELVVGADKAGITISSNGLFIPSEIPVSTVDELKAAMLLENANIVLQNDIKLTANLTIPVAAPATPAKNVTINGNGHKIYAEEDFIGVDENTDKNGNNLVTVVGENVTLKNITLQTGPNNKNALNLYKAKGVVLDNVVLDNQFSFGGAPLIVGSSDVTVQNGLKAIAGPNSWYAINLDNKYADAGIKFEDKTFTFVNNSGKDLPVIGVDYYPATGNKLVVENPGNANLVVDGKGNYVCDHSKTEIRNNKDATPDSEGYTGDTYCTICGKLLSKGTVVAKVDEHPEIGEAIANGTWGKDEATATPKPATSAAGSTATVTTTNNSIPQTADEMNIGLLMMLLVVSAAGLTGTVLYTRKNKAK